jgi:hypothetical protein
MSTVLEIESALEKLSPGEAREVANWLVARLPKPDAKARLASLRKACGIWKDRLDLPDVRSLRAEWDCR